MSALAAFADNVSTVDGPQVRDMGVMFTTRMTVVKLSSGLLWVDSPVSVPSETLDRIAALGPIKYLVAGTPRHVWRLAAWHPLFPEAELWQPCTTAFTLKHGVLPLTGTLGDEAPEGWADDFQQLTFKGNPLIEEVIFFHKRSRTVILDDLIQVHGTVAGRPFRNALVRLGGVASPNGGVSLDIRLSFIHRSRARASLRKLLSWDFDRLIIAHGPCIASGARAFVERAFNWLGP